MFVILNEDGIKYHIYHTRNHVEVIATKNERTVRVEGRTRKESIDKARRKLKEIAHPKQ